MPTPTDTINQARYALAFISRFAGRAVKTASRDVCDWSEDMAYIAKLADDLLTGIEQAAEHTPAGPEAEAAADAALGLVALPTIRISAHAYSGLERIAAATGTTVQAVAREMLEPGETMGAAQQAAYPVGDVTDALRYRWLRERMAYFILCDFPCDADGAKPSLPYGRENWPQGLDAAIDRYMLAGATATAHAQPQATAQPLSDARLSTIQNGVLVRLGVAMSRGEIQPGEDSALFPIWFGRAVLAAADMAATRAAPARRADD